MGKSKGKLESLKSTNGGERGDEHLLIFVSLNRWEEERDVMEDMEKYKYPLPPNGYLSAAMLP